MQTSEIQKRINALPALMSAKGKITPEAIVCLSANALPTLMLTWHKKAGDWSSREHFVSRQSEDIGAMLTQAEQFVADLPSREQESTRQFLQGLSDLIEIGRNTGIDVAHVNPLVEQMKALSKNTIGFTPKPYADQAAL